MFVHIHIQDIIYKKHHNVNFDMLFIGPNGVSTQLNVVGLVFWHHGEFNKNLNH